MIKKLGSKIKLFIFIITILAITIEIFSLIATKLNLLLVNKEPDYFYSSGNKWRNEIMPWGAWHKINFKDHHSMECFDVEYESNNLGARDNEPYDENLPANSIILIGDSWAEGFGVNLNDTFAEVLEKKIGRKVLNFGSSAFFGAVQEEILYRTLASKLPHSEIIYFFNPVNDFIENDRRYWNSKFNKFRHRPYFKKVGDDEYDIFYPSYGGGNKFLIYVKSLIFHRLQVFLVQYTYTANTLRTINALYAKINREKDVAVQNTNSGNFYFFDDHEAIDGTLHFSKKLLSKASNLERRLIVIIPILSDLINIYEGNDYKNLKWYLDLKRIASETNSILFDLAEYIKKEDYNKMVLECDGHWNAYGHRIVAELVRENFFK